MRIFTSCYKEMNFLERNGVLPVSISRFPPARFAGPVFDMLAPSKELLLRYRDDLDWKRYKTDFYGQLLGLDIAETCNALRKISEDNGGKDLALCCFEDRNEPCHRHIVADFFNEFGIMGGDVHEFSAKDTVREEEALF